jgi:hypothetical protein
VGAAGYNVSVMSVQAGDSLNPVRKDLHQADYSPRLETREPLMEERMGRDFLPIDIDADVKSHIRQERKVLTTKPFSTHVSGGSRWIIGGTPSKKDGTV